MVRFLRLLVSVFFRQVAVVGDEHLPDGGPTIFAGNHPNSLIDPVLIITTCGRKIHFAAKDVLFKNAALRVVLNALGAVPVYRKMDHSTRTTAGGGTGAGNEDTFAALHQVLAHSGAMGIFPEGISHDEAQLQRLKTGAARIAVGLVAKEPQVTVRIVPCGLNYMSRKRFRSRALVQYGPPIEVDLSYLRQDEEAQREVIRSLTERLSTAMRELTVNADDWDTLRVLEAVRRLYQPDGIPLRQRVELARRFTAVYADVRDSPDIRAIYGKVHSYQQRLDEAGLTDRIVMRRLGPLDLLLRAMGNLIRVAFWAPLAIPGLLLHAPLGLIAGKLGPILAPRTDVAATGKLVLGTGLVALTWLAVVVPTWFALGTRASLIVAALLPISGYAALRVLERGASLNRLARHGWRAITLRRETRILRAQRDALVEAIDDAVALHLPQDMERLYPARNVRFSAEELGH
jgi:glycerol-3-phosphate O-acyltransferase/dihydroxyacetone phosphate acyltransferase